MQNKIEISETGEKRPPLQRGQFWNRKGEVYLLAYIGNGNYVLVALKDGGFWDAPGEIERVFGGDPEFSLVKGPFTVTPDL